jgi:membrane protein
MDKKSFVQDLSRHIRSLFPLFRYLILQTETHAFCLALACAALLGFYPFCVLLLSVSKNVLHWDGAYNVGLAAIQAYFPTDPRGMDVVLRNLRVSVGSAGRSLDITAMFWVFLGAAGIFIPLEAGLNRLWKVQDDRPYWRNQVVGFTLTVACCLLAITFIALNAVIRGSVGFVVPFDFLRRVSDATVLKVTAVGFFSLAILLFYKFLPNRKVDTMQVLPAAILAGIVGEIVKDIFVIVLPLTNIGITQGPFDVSISFVLLAYFETFVVLGGAFLATQSEVYPWMGFIRRRGKPEVIPSPPPDGSPHSSENPERISPA